MKKGLITVVILLGAVFALRMFASLWLLLLLAALALAVLASADVIGKWGYAAAAAVGVLAVPSFLLRTLFASLTLLAKTTVALFKLAPFILVGVLIWMLIRSFRR